MSAGRPGGRWPRGVRLRSFGIRGRLRQIFLYGAARGLAEGLLGVRGLLLATILGPPAFGAWTLFRIASRYGAFAGIGIFRGLEREVSREAGGGSVAEAERYANTAAGFGLLAFGSLGLLAFAASFLTRDPQFALGLRGFAAAVVVEQGVFYVLAYVRSMGNLRRCAALEVTSSALHLTFSTVLGLVWGLGGAFAGFVLAGAASVALLGRDVPRRPALSPPRLRRLLGTGLPVAVSLLLSTALTTGDSLVVAAFGGTTLLGYYGFAAAAAGMTGALAWVVRTVIFPGLYGQAHAEGRGAALREHIDHTLRPYAWLYPPILGILALAIGPAVSLAAPGYTPAVAPARIFLFTGVTFGLATIGSVGLVAADRQATLPLLSAFALLANVGLSTLAMWLGLGLEAVAAGALVSQTGYAAAVVLLTARIAGSEHPRRLVAATLAPLAYCVTLVFALGRLVPGTGAGSTALSALVYAAAMIPLLPRLMPELRKLQTP